MGENRHQEKTAAARIRVAALEKPTSLDPALVSEAANSRCFRDVDIRDGVIVQYRPVHTNLL